MGKGKEEGTVKIADFGLARIFQSPLRPLSDNGVVVTIWYRAPELLLGAKHYTRAVDIWAIGCIFAELINCKPLFPGKEKDHKNPKAFQEDQLQKIFNILGRVTLDSWPEAKCLPDYPKIKDWTDMNGDSDKSLRNNVKGVGAKGFELISKMLEYDPSKRITAESALDHPYFQDHPKPSLNAFAFVNTKELYPRRQELPKPATTQPTTNTQQGPPTKKRKVTSPDSN